MFTTVYCSAFFTHPSGHAAGHPMRSAAVRRSLEISVVRPSRRRCTSPSLKERALESVRSSAQRQSPSGAQETRTYSLHAGTKQTESEITNSRHSDAGGWSLLAEHPTTTQNTEAARDGGAGDWRQERRRSRHHHQPLRCQTQHSPPRFTPLLVLLILEVFVSNAASESVAIV
ncbi:hypothetical protein E2C01_076510 [Portunus trituberculatus]|uniref:Uncharacterized protein n=1 Tax=Portunus trituberculatus TaxID=210409 RepID=A0A5B7IDE0_PORTR|nr:hypothetical protein [Portunus trituberculatus]